MCEKTPKPGCTAETAAAICAVFFAKGLGANRELSLIAIVEERDRQISGEGWTPELGSEHENGQLAKVAAAYAHHSALHHGHYYVPLDNPWRHGIRDNAGNLLGAAVVGRTVRAASRTDRIPANDTCPAVIRSNTLCNRAHGDQCSRSSHNSRGKFLPKGQRQCLLYRQYAAVPVEDAAFVDAQVIELMKADHAHPFWPADWICFEERDILQSSLSLILSITHPTTLVWPAAVHLHSQTQNCKEDRKICQASPTVHVLLRLSFTFSLTRIKLCLFCGLYLCRGSEDTVAESELFSFQLLDLITREALAAHRADQIDGQKRERDRIQYQTNLAPPLCRQHVRYPFSVSDEVSSDSPMASKRGTGTIAIALKTPIALTECGGHRLATNNLKDTAWALSAEHAFAVVLLNLMKGDAHMAAAMLNEGLVPGIEARLALYASKGIQL